MSDAPFNPSDASRAPRPGYGNAPLWVPSQQHGSGAMASSDLNTNYEPSTNQPQDMRALQQQSIQADTNPILHQAGVHTASCLLEQPASYPATTHYATGAPSSAPAGPTCSSSSMDDKQQVHQCETPV